VFIVAPFISFGKSYEAVILDAASVYGFSPDEYRIEFKDELTDNEGNDVCGLYYGTENVDGTDVHIIEIKNHFLRTVIVETIFHEFAHAAQAKYDLDNQGYSMEQHAEILCFSTMWNNGYGWDALHLLPSHTFFAKTKEYNAADELWQIALTGETTILDAAVRSM
jgi:hypothetical protein